MKRDPQRIAAEAASHVTVGFLQGTGFALGSVAVGLALTAIATVLSGPGGILVALVVGLVIYKKFKKDKSPVTRQEADAELALIEAQEIEYRAATSERSPSQSRWPSVVSLLGLIIFLGILFFMSSR
jgi:hypothetical protein